jgi:SAM-dependent methyltransferase
VTVDADIYDKRYEGDYRAALCGYEFSRWDALKHFIPRVVGKSNARRVLDYGSGRGLFAPLWEEVFPKAELWFCDLSATALAKLGEDFPRHAERCALVTNNHAKLADESFEVVVSIEVMEHVVDLGAYLRDIHRLLSPGGTFIWTTPCANVLSIEHLYALITGQIDPTPEHYRRWRWEDPTHLRRLKTREIRRILKDIGFSSVGFRLWSHFFSFFMTYVAPQVRPYRLRPILQRHERFLINLDYTYLRWLPNGASMLGYAIKS